MDVILEELKAECLQQPEKNGRCSYAASFKKKVVDYHYKSGKSFAAVERDVGIKQYQLDKWKKALGKEKTGFIFGDSIRNDLRTKALAVQEALETNTKNTVVAKKYGVTSQTVANWIHLYGKDYKELLNSRDGIPYLVKEEKMVFGNDNIDAILDIKTKHVAELTQIVNLMHNNGFTKTLIKEVQNKEKLLTKDIETLNKAKEIIKKTK